jgi:hypothetical protein
MSVCGGIATKIASLINLPPLFCSLLFYLLASIIVANRLD